MFYLTPIAASVQAICRNWPLFSSGRASQNDWRNLNYEVAVRSRRF